MRGDSADRIDISATIRQYQTSTAGIRARKRRARPVLAVSVIRALTSGYVMVRHRSRSNLLNAGVHPGAPGGGPARDSPAPGGSGTFPGNLRIAAGGAVAIDHLRTEGWGA
ncbi:hypothetical protein GCM10009839_83690 [Catenulispora yoronensis]|uniref:Uncharacterized protein n=1 Tax=Catenulispora yoronensis TaxID=450799 RepID=A0ABN2VGR9_9ACTN